MNTAKTIVSITDPLEMAGFIKSNGTQCRFVSLVSRTPVVDIRAGNPWGASKKTKGGLFKVSRKNGIVNANYVASVQRRIAEKLGVMVSEVEYEAGEVWYQHLQTVDGKALPLVQHKDEAKWGGKLYLQYYPHKATSVYVNEQGDEVDAALVESWLFAKAERPDYKPTVITIELGNVKELRASGVIMQAEDLVEAEAALQ